MKFPNDRQHVDARSERRTEHFDDFTFGINVARFPRFQPNYDFIANLWGNFGSYERQASHGGLVPWRTGNLPYVNVVHEARVIRHDVIKIPRTLESADNRIVSSFQNSNHAPFATPFDAPIRFILRYARDHTVAMHGCSDVFRRDENVRLPRHFGREKSVAGLMNRQFAGYQVSLSRQNISVLSDASDLAGAFELAQALAQRNPPGGRHAHLARDFDLVERPIIFPRKQTQNLFSNVTSVQSHLSETIAPGFSIYCDFDRRSNHAKSDCCRRVRDCPGDCLICRRRSQDEDQKFRFARRWKYSVKIHM